jgi:putative DNA methylase
MPNNDRRLIEDLIPIREIGIAISTKKNKNDISSLHLWWARRPLIAVRAAVYSTLVPAPNNDKERESYMEHLRKLCDWDIPASVLEQACKDILVANNGQQPQVLA